MALLLPADPAPETYRFAVTLDGVLFQLRWRWNTRAACWLVDVFDADEEPVIYGRRVSLDVDVLRQVHHLEAPFGALIAYDTTTRQTPPGRADLGDRVIALYLELAEVAALAGVSA